MPVVSGGQERANEDCYKALLKSDRWVLNQAMKLGKSSSVCARPNRSLAGDAHRLRAPVSTYFRKGKLSPLVDVISLQLKLPLPVQPRANSNHSGASAPTPRSGDLVKQQDSPTVLPSPSWHLSSWPLRRLSKSPFHASLDMQPCGHTRPPHERVVTRISHQAPSAASRPGPAWLRAEFKQPL